MSSSTDPDLSAVLEPQETLLWSGGPNREVMLSTMGKRKKPNFTFAIAAVVFIGGFGWMNRAQLSGLNFDGPTQSFSPLFFGLIPIAAGMALIFRWNAGKARRYVDSLAYAITDRRILIHHGGKETESFTPDQVQQARLEERAGAEGYYDIIWGGRRLPTDSEGHAITNPLVQERARMGFKALRDGPAVFEQIQSWLQESGPGSD